MDPIDPLNPARRSVAPYSMSRPSSIGAISGATSGIRPVSLSQRASVARDVGHHAGSRFWIVAVILLIVLAIAAFVLLRMAQMGAFLSF